MVFQRAYLATTNVAIFQGGRMNHAKNGSAGMADFENGSRGESGVVVVQHFNGLRSVRSSDGKGAWHAVWSLRWGAGLFKHHIEAS